MWAKTPDLINNESWCWVKYKGKHGIVKCPARLTFFKSGEALLSTAKNDSFIKSAESNDWQYNGKIDAYLRFGPVIKEPQD